MGMTQMNYKVIDRETYVERFVGFLNKHFEKQVNDDV